MQTRQFQPHKTERENIAMRSRKIRTQTPIPVLTMADLTNIRTVLAVADFGDAWTKTIADLYAKIGLIRDSIGTSQDSRQR